MHFLNPTLLVWGWLAAAAVALYLFRRRPRTVRVSTMPFFKTLAREHQESAWLRRLKRLISLLLTVLVLMAAVGALARMVIAPATKDLDTVVILIDRSASMAARDAAGTSRMDAALAVVRERLAGLPGDVGVLVMAYDRRPQILLPRSLDRRSVKRALDSIRVRPVGGNAQLALDLAARLAALETPASIWHATDTPLPAVGENEDETLPGGDAAAASRNGVAPAGAPSAGADAKNPAEDDGPTALAASLPEDVREERIDVGLREPVNAGITAVKLRRLPLEHRDYEAFVQVHGTGLKDNRVKLKVYVDDTLVATPKLKLSKQGFARRLLPILHEKGGDRIGIVRLQVVVEGDCLSLDDEVFLRVPDEKPLKVLWVTQDADPFTELALRTLEGEGDVQLIGPLPPEKWTGPADADLVLFDCWLPETWPAEVTVVALNPPRTLGPVRVERTLGEGVPVETLRVVAPDHPLLFGVANDRISLVQTSVLDPHGPLEPLWSGTSGPMFVAGEVRGQRVAALAFDPRRSERLQLMASYPLLIGNLVYWSQSERERENPGNNHRTGDIVALEGETLIWEDPDGARGGERRVSLRSDQAVKRAELDRTGLWRTDAGQTGSAAVLSAEETLLPKSSRTEDGAHARQTAVSRWGLRGEISIHLLAMLVLLLLVESLLFHRFAVY